MHSTQSSSHYITYYKGHKEKGYGLVGLKNNNLTCYMNSIVQCLSNTDILKNYITENSALINILKFKYKVNDVIELIQKDLNIFNIFRLIKSLWVGSSESDYYCEMFKKRVFTSFNDFRQFQQNDSHEFLGISIGFYS